MAFEELTEPRKSYAPKQVYASFDVKTEPIGLTGPRPSASLLKDTPPSIIVALAKLSPIITTLDSVLALITWTGDDAWSSFIVLSIWWLSCIYAEYILHYFGNWVFVGVLAIGYFRRRIRTRRIARAIHFGADPLTAGTEDAQKLVDRTLYEIDCFSARCQLWGSTFESLYKLYSWQDPKWSALISLRLVFMSPVYIAVLWLLSTRAVVLVTGTILLTCTSPWFKTICTISWRLRSVRKLASILFGISYLPGESNLLNTLSSSPKFGGFSFPDSKVAETTAEGSRFTTLITVTENQRKWLGLGWTPSLLPHERSPFTDTDNVVCPSPENYGLPNPKTTIENGKQMSTTWRWLDTAWRIEKDRNRDPEGWIYFDNSWHNPSAREEYSKYTRRRKWLRNAECIERVESPVPTPRSQSPPKSPQREWRSVEGGGKELVDVAVRRRPAQVRRTSTIGNTS